MYNNTFGNIFRLTSFGESHGKGIGGVIDGFPAGIHIDMDFIQKELDRGWISFWNIRWSFHRMPHRFRGMEHQSTFRRLWQHEGCLPSVACWFHIYSKVRTARPSRRRGLRDHRGGGRSSARETISRVVAGALAKIALKQLGVEITAYTSQVCELKLDKAYTSYDLSEIEKNPVRCPDPVMAQTMAELILKTKGEGDTIGGTVDCVIKGCR